MLYYLPRPRRFGKSLMISTLKALFLGRRELFKGLAIERTDWDWENEVYPVIHLDMSKASATNFAGFEDKLSKMMEIFCEQFSIPYDPAARRTIGEVKTDAATTSASSFRG